MITEPPPQDHYYSGPTSSPGHAVPLLTGIIYVEADPLDLRRAAATVCRHAAGEDKAGRRADALQLLDELGLPVPDLTAGGPS